jgi:formate dehydrogenase alpha subunit
VVEVEGLRTLVGACHTPAVEGMVIHTHSPKVLAARRVIVELLLASHPDNCLVCDKANLCELRRIAADLYVGIPRFRIKKHYYPIEDENPYIIRDMSKCIMCRRCINACQKIGNGNIFSVAYRGFNSKVIYKCDQVLGSEETCRYCDICISVCPTGALTKPLKIGEEKLGKTVFVNS